MKRGIFIVVTILCMIPVQGFGKDRGSFSSGSLFNREDSTDEPLSITAPLPNVWGLDILISNGGFGLGTFYRRTFSKDIFGFASFSISESKDDRETEFIDPFTLITFTPGKLNRFLVMPLTFGVQHRLFRDEILDTFRPYVNIGAGPTIIFMAPAIDISRTVSGDLLFTPVEFFNSLGRGRPHYTVGGYIGVGANFGSDSNNLFGLNFRYYFTYLFGEGLPSLYNSRTGNVSSTKKEFGGFFITVNVGMAY